METVNITYNGKYKTEDGENIDISAIDSIPNFSASNLRASFLNTLEKEKAVALISTLLNKLKKNGTLTLKLLDIRNLFLYYENRQIDDNGICKNMKDIQCVISKAEIAGLFQNNKELVIDNMTYDFIHNLYTIRRINI